MYLTSSVPSISNALPLISKTNEILKDYSYILKPVALVALAIAAFARKHIAAVINSKWNARKLRSGLDSDFYSRADVLSATKYFIEPNCQSIDPSGAENFRGVFPAREAAFKALDGLLGMDAAEKFTLILGDSGMGKSTLLLNYLARHIRKRNPPFVLSLIPLGSASCDSAIKALNNRPNTVLLLDAFDEDTQAIKDHRSRLETILDETRDFRHVVITCRTQFFISDNEIPRETGVMRFGFTKAGQSKDYLIQKLYISPFDSKQVREYLKIRFPFWRYGERTKAAQFCEQIPDLTMRPMLLAHVQDLLHSKSRVKWSVQIYELMIEAWLIREKPFVEPNSLRIFSEAIAVDVYSNRQLRGSEKIPAKDASDLVNRNSIPLQPTQFRGRSLLNRDAEGNLKFAHRTFMEFLFVSSFLKDPTRAPKQKWTDQMKIFWWEHLAFLIDGLQAAKNQNDECRHLQRLVDEASKFGDTDGFEDLLIHPLIPVSNTAEKHSGPKELQAFCVQFTSSDEGSNTKRRAIPALLKKVRIAGDGFRGLSTEVCVDFVTGLTWDLAPSRACTFEEVTYSIQRRNEKATDGSVWRLPSLCEALTLLPPLSPDGEDPRKIFVNWSFPIWTGDTIDFKEGYSIHYPSNHVVFIPNESELARSDTHATMRLVKDFRGITGLSE